MEYIKDLFNNINLSSISLPNIRTTDIVDIAVVAVVIYMLLIWIKETRAWSLFKGILTILVLNILATQFNLYTVEWIIQKTLSVGIIAIIVLFQPEFRKGLEQLGRGNFVTKVFNIDDDYSISVRAVDAILGAVTSMSRMKTGALILIEKDVPVGDLEETGIRIDAEVSSQLLINIFENKTPLHDGAVIIRNNRVAAATCIFPLTTKEIGLEYGTRHRAAVGASEISDAFIIVVSEETGNTSVALQGSLYKNLSVDEIRKMLIDAPGDKPGKIALWKGSKLNEKK